MESRILEALGNEQDRFQRLVPVEVFYVYWHF